MAGEADLKAQIVIEAQDQASAVLRNLSGSLSQLGGAFGQIAGMAGPVGLAVGALASGLLAVVNTGRGVADQVEQLDLLATRTGVSSEALQVLNRQITEMGGNTGSLTQALTFLNRSLATNDPLLAQLGVTSKDTLTAFQQLSTAFAGSDDTAKKTEIAYRLLGRGSAELLGILPQLSAGFDKTKASMEAAGGVMTGSVLEAARQLDAEADKLDSAWANLMTRMKAATIPTAIAVTQALNDMWDAMTGNKQSPEEAAARRIGALQQQIAANQSFISAAQKRGATPAFLQEYQDLVANLQLQLGKLQGIRADTEQAEADMLAADLARTLATGKDVVKDVQLDAPKKAEKSARETEIERIAAALRILKPEATQVYEALQRISEGKFAQGIKDALTAGPEVSAEMAATNAEIDAMAKLFGSSREEAEGLIARLKDLGDERQRQAILNQLQGEQAFTVDDALTKWTEAVVEMQDLANVVDETFGSLFQGLENGFNTVFQNLLTEGQTFASAMQTLFRSLVSALLSELARLAAVAVFKQILGFFTGGVTSGLGAAGTLPGDFPHLEAPTPTEPTFAVMPPIELPPVEIMAPPPLDIPPTELVAPPPLELPQAELVAPPPLELPQQNIVAPPPLELPTPSILQPRPALAFERAPQPIAEPVNISVNPPVSEPLPVEVAPVGNTFNVYTYDAHTIVADLVSPSGKLRRAQDTVAVLGAY